MNAEYINAFIQGATSTFINITGEAPELGKVYVKDRQHKFEEVSVQVDLLQDLNGHVIYTLNDEAGFKIIQKMLMGMHISKWDEMAISGIQELCNMVSGSVAVKLSALKKNVDISVPTFRHDATRYDFPFIHEKSYIICIPLTFLGEHVFEIDILIFKE